ncbi:MAG TPA: ATPase [Sphingomicrobium sp.]|nr:ATPase [Sphingomicrobium sp.]
MPQLDQLTDVAFSQVFWLLIGLALIYFGVAKAMVPKIQSTVDKRDAQIAGDLAAAEQARADAEATEEAYRVAMDKSRAEATKLTAAAKQEGAKATEKRVAEAAKAIEAKIEKAEARMRKAADSARAEIDSVAADLVREITEKVAGIAVTPDEAAKALKASANG